MATNPFDILGQQGISPLGGANLLAPQQALPQPPLLTSPAPPMEREDAPIRRLRPGSDLHKSVLAKLKGMKRFSQSEMKKHYNRWNFGEERTQAYIPMQDYEQLVKAMQQKGASPPEPIQVVVPYSYATLHAAATFIAQVLFARRPLFPLQASRGSTVDKARRMEQALQYNIDASRGAEQLWQFVWDSLIYGFGTTRNSWDTQFGPAIRWVNGQREFTNELKFAGNVIDAVDPYRFFPDPRVPIHQSNIKGDFSFVEISLSNTVLTDMEKAEQYLWVKEGLAAARTTRGHEMGNESRRRLKIGIGGEQLITPQDVVGFSTVTDGTVRLVPKDWGLGDSTDSALWKFAWLDGQIVQAEPLGMLHGQHPFASTEPTTFGHDFMSVSMSDMIGPFQDILSWLVSSRMENVRSSINNQFVLDPGRVELNDIRSSVIGRIIRLKQAAIGTPIDEVIKQLPVVDVTQGHLADIQTMRILADTITGVNDNLRGIQTAGGRRSATEARMSMQAGANRLSQMAIRVSAQGLLPMVQQMIFNTQQFMPPEMWVETTGDDGTLTGELMSPDMLVGNFNFQVSDGTLPFDKTAMLETWKEVLFGVAQDPELRQSYDIGKIFRYVAELGGARNVDSFQRQQQPQLLAGAANNPGADPNMMPIAPAQPSGPMF